MNLPASITSDHLLIALALLLLIILLWLLIRHWRQPKFRQTPIMTDNEREFFHRLVKAAPDCYIFAQVAMGALVQPAQGSNPKAFMRAHGTIGAKRIDYAIHDADLKLLCLVELDDSSHDEEKDKARDKITASVGIPTIRWRSARAQRPSVAQIRRQIEALKKTAGSN